ncbi:hypothetical protein [Lacticaseibacillus rhamnosus]|uniref:hypothetical protein n=1 Tax=Lacticaseibacillus rhamnosus TaxID=47715 RepID=UPI000A4F8F96|nr:hypothetical protein [Lacticaseibacillus rhamnosus]
MRTWFQYRTPLQLGLLLVGGWTILSIFFVVLILAFTPANMSIGGLFIPTVYRLDNGAVTIDWSSYLWLFAALCGYLMGARFRRSKTPFSLMKAYTPLIVLWFLVVVLAQWYPLANLTHPHSLDGFLLQVILNFSWVMPAGSISLLVGLSAKGGRLASCFGSFSLSKVNSIGNWLSMARVGLGL